MIKNMILAVALLAAASTGSLCQDAPKLRIEGEQTVIVKSPFKLHFDQEVDLAFWITLSPGVELIGAVPTVPSVGVKATPGRHKIRLIAIKTDYKLGKTIPYDIEQEFIVADGPVIPDPDDPVDPDPDPDDPDDPPPSDFTAVEAASRSAMEALDDAVTARAIANSVGTLEFDGTVEEIRVRYQSKVAEALSSRTGDSRNKDWFSWRVSVSEAIEKFKPLTVAKLKGCILAAVAPLGMAELKRPIVLKPKQEPSAKPSDRETVMRAHVIAYGRANCGDCVRWERDEEPKFRERGFSVKHYIALDGSVPRFRVFLGDQEFQRSGYLPLADVEALLADIVGARKG